MDPSSPELKLVVADDIANLMYSKIKIAGWRLGSSHSSFGLPQMAQRFRAGRMSVADLVSVLNKSDEWLICSLVHKFGASDEPDVDSFLEDIHKHLPKDFYPKRDVFVFVDECHWTHKGSGKLHQAMTTLLPPSAAGGSNFHPSQPWPALGGIRTRNRLPCGPLGLIRSVRSSHEFQSQLIGRLQQLFAASHGTDNRLDTTYDGWRNGIARRGWMHGIAETSCGGR
jgi:hypothetical protein